MAIGFWYMNGPGDVITAWTLALYIVTAAAGKPALLQLLMDALIIFSTDCVDGYHWEFERYLSVVFAESIDCVVLFLSGIIPKELVTTKLPKSRRWEERNIALQCIYRS